MKTIKNILKKKKSMDFFAIDAEVIQALNFITHVTVPVIKVSP